MIEEILNRIEKIAEFLRVTKWDWVAIIIALFSFIIAFKTLLSQKQTAKNTKKIMSEENQLILMKGILHKLLDGYLVFTAIYNAMQKSGFHTFPLDYIPRKYKIDTEDIHEELFYYSKKDYEKEVKYNLMCKLSDYTSDYNNRIDTFISLSQNNAISEETIKISLAGIIQRNCNVAEQTIKVMNIIWDTKPQEFADLFQIPLQSDSLDRKDDETILEYDDNTYTSVFQDEQQRKTFIHNKETRISDLIRTLKPLMVQFTNNMQDK